MTEALPLVPSDQRYTPRWVLELATYACGPIHYDPCTIPSNPTGALDFSALPEDGLAQDWLSRSRGKLIWVNSPFSRGQLKQWAQKAADEHERGCEIVMLTPVDSSTEWFVTLSRAARCAALLTKRVKYDVPADQEGFESSAKGAAMLWYLGLDLRAFVNSAGRSAHLYQPGVF